MGPRRGGTAAVTFGVAVGSDSVDHAQERGLDVVVLSDPAEDADGDSEPEHSSVDGRPLVGAQPAECQQAPSEQAGGQSAGHWRWPWTLDSGGQSARFIAERECVHFRRCHFVWVLAIWPTL